MSHTRIVMKFGGTSLGAGEKIRMSAEIIREESAKVKEIVVVASAMGDVTDRLTLVARSASTGDRAEVMKLLDRLRIDHGSAVEKAITSRQYMQEAIDDITRAVDELERLLGGIASLHELTPRSMDYVVSFGERLSSPILKCALMDLGLRAKWMTGGDAGIITDQNFGRAKPLVNITNRLVKEKLEPLVRQGVIPVVSGFMACTQEGIITTLGRGGSDYTATILAAALKAEEVWMWSDVDGLMTADPKIEPSARTLKSISFAEALEMAYFGAKGMHFRALQPAYDLSILVRIKNTFKPKNEGTLIVKEQVTTEGVVKAIALITNVALVTVSGAGMLGTPGIVAKVFTILAEKNIDIVMVSQGSSQANISFVIPRDTLQQAVNALELALLGGGEVTAIESEPDVCILAVIGAGMKGTPGVASRVFAAVAKSGINVRMIAQGSSELNISFLVSEKDGAPAVRALHKEFELGSRPP